MPKPPHHRQRRFTGFFVALTVVVLACFPAFNYIKSTPRYSLYQFKNAILSHDPEKALLYLDVDGIVDNMVTENLPGEATAGDPSAKATENRKYGIARDAVTQNLPAIKKQLREQLESAILAYNDRAALEKLSGASILGLTISTRGDTAFVKIRGSDKTAFRMGRSSGGHWRIVAINLKELLPASK